ncbi:DUF4158 domain-containing protein [Streptomyces sp. P3]|uniref:DUF4158 domain-containing protein n=1 Tax=Streptomyces sp. P3 TaxID=2135430 RepID=UPI00131F3C67|nr:DUF4158 domain-containing protein [Streptomyces sp. P3]
MPTNFLSEEQRRRFGHFTEDPDEGQLAGSFLLDQTARRRAMATRCARNRIGWAVQLGTIRYLGTFLNNPEEVPAGVVAWFALARWLYQRAWIGNERPTLLLDLATKRLVDKKVVLPGVTVLERLVSGNRERAEKRLWATLAAVKVGSGSAGPRRCPPAVAAVRPPVSTRPASPPEPPPRASSTAGAP